MPSASVLEIYRTNNVKHLNVRGTIAQRFAPTFNNVLAFLNEEAGRDWKRIQQHIAQVIRDFSEQEDLEP